MLAIRRAFTRELLIGATVAVILGCAAFVYGLRTLESFLRDYVLFIEPKEKGLRMKRGEEPRLDVATRRQAWTSLPFNKVKAG